MIHEHHRRLRSQGGGDEPTNVIGLPDVIHDWIHANPEAAKEAGLIVPEWEDPANVKVTIPEEALRKVRAGKSQDEAPRPRATVGIKVPKDERENGAEVLLTLIEECRKELVGEFNWQDDVPNYFVLTAVMADWLNGRSDDS